MAKKSYELGKNFELQLCEYFAKNNYYVIYNEKGVTGSQPVDMVVIKNNIATMIECKNLENSNSFPINRLEMNQLLSYKRFCECNNTNFIIAIKNKNNVYFIDFGLLQFYKKSIPLNKIEPNIKNWNEVIDNIQKEQK